MGPIPHFRAHSCAGTPGAVSSDYVFAASGKGCLRFANLHLVRQFGDSGGTLLNQQDKFAEMEAGFINWVARLLSFGGDTTHRGYLCELPNLSFYAKSSRKPAGSQEIDHFRDDMFVENCVSFKARRAHEGSQENNFPSHT